MHVRVCSPSLSERKTKVTAECVASRAVSIHHDVVTVSLVPGKTTSNILLAKPLFEFWRTPSTSAMVSVNGSR